MGPLGWSLLKAGGSPPAVVLGSAPREETRREPPVQVWLHNDPVTPAEYVVMILEQVFGFGLGRATWIMAKAHFTGRARVGAYPREEAEAKVAAAHRRAREEGWPLRFSVEP